MDAALTKGLGGPPQMGMVINTNVDALDALRNLGITASKFSASVQKLSSGLRINTAADDAAGLAISNKLEAQVNGLNQAQRNAQDGVSMVQTASGALTEITSMLQRIRELAVEAANATIGSSDAASINTEIGALQTEINRIGGATTFNGQNLLTGSLSVALGNGGSLSVGKALNTGHAATVSGIDVSAARAGSTYSLASNSAGTLTMTLGTLSQTVNLQAMGATGTQTITFGQLGVRITVAGDPAKTAAELASDLVGAVAPTTAIAGTLGTNLVNGVTLTQTSTTPVVMTNVWEGAPGVWAISNSPPVSATASAGVAQGTLVISTTALGHVTGTLGGENFAGDMSAFSPGSLSQAVLTGSRGNTITINYRQNTTAANLADEATDLSNGRATFVSGPGTATVSGIASTLAAVGGTYTFSSAAQGQLTLTGPGGTQTVAVNDMAALGTQTLDFSTLGISFTLTADGNGISAAAAISSLLKASDNTVVVTSNPGSAGGSTIVTAAGNNSAQFQIGANAIDTMSITFGNVNTSTYTGFDAAVTAFNTAVGSQAAWAAGQGTATAALINAVDKGIDSINGIASGLGAAQNRLGYIIAAVGVASENLNSSESRIRDLNVAAEMVNFTKTQILQQAGTAILAQANSAPQSILTLLR
jgi:flagellin